MPRPTRSPTLAGATTVFHLQQIDILASADGEEGLTTDLFLVLGTPSPAAHPKLPASRSFFSSL